MRRRIPEHFSSKKIKVLDEFDSKGGEEDGQHSDRQAVARLG
jgi:hypothetical protein